MPRKKRNKAQKFLDDFHQNSNLTTPLTGVPLLSQVEVPTSTVNTRQVDPPRRVAPFSDEIIATDERGSPVTFGTREQQALQGAAIGATTEDFEYGSSPFSVDDRVQGAHPFNDLDKEAQVFRDTIEFGPYGAYTKRQVPGSRFPEATDERGGPSHKNLALVPQRITEQNSRIPMGIFSEATPELQRARPKTRRGRMIQSLIEQENQKRIKEGARNVEDLVPMVQKSRGVFIGPDDFVVKGKI